jgi:hypothetical protein
MKPRLKHQWWFIKEERINIDFVKKINQKIVKDFQDKTEETETEKKKKKQNWRK